MQIRQWINICRNFHQTHSFLVVTNIIFLRFYTSLLLTLMLTLLLYICKILITEVHQALTCILMYRVCCCVLQRVLFLSAIHLYLIQLWCPYVGPCPENHQQYRSYLYLPPEAPQLCPGGREGSDDVELVQKV